MKPLFVILREAFFFILREAPFRHSARSEAQSQNLSNEVQPGNQPLPPESEPTHTIHLRRALALTYTRRMKRIAVLLLLFAFAGGVRAQDVSTEALLGTFEGPLVIGRDSMTLAFTFSMNGDELRAQLFSAGMGIYGMPANSVSIVENALRIAIPRLDLEFTGRLRLDESGEQIQRIDGDWFQYSEMIPVILLPVDAPSF